MIEQFEQFIKERQFISNVSPRTVEWYRESFKWLDENPELTPDELKSLLFGCGKPDSKRRVATTAFEH